MVIACSEPLKSRARWTLHLLCDELKKRKVVVSVLRELVRQALKKYHQTLEPGNMVHPAKQDAASVCAMEQVLEVYILPYDSVCMYETSKQCVNEIRPTLPMSSARPARYDAECERNGVAHLLLLYAPLRNWRSVEVKQDHTVSTWAEGIRRLVEEDFPEAQQITLVMDNLNSHNCASLCKTFVPEKARRLLDKLESVYTPKTRMLAQFGGMRV